MVTKKYILAGMVGVALSFGAPAVLALAQTDIWVGGNTDCTSQGYMHADGNPIAGHNNVPVAYGTCDGDFAPFLGSTTASDAIAQGVAATHQAWDANCANTSESCTLHGFSIGAASASIVANDVGADKPGSNTHLITEGNAWGQPGVFGGKPGFIGFWINVGAPFAGVPLHVDQVAGSENRFNVNDGFADDATQAPNVEIVNLSCLNHCDDLPPQHFIQSGSPAATFKTNDGVKQEVYGDPLPGVIPPQDNPVVNPELTPTAPVTSAVPSFFGEAPCVADNGGQYFTPGDSPC
jgi:hypothetical protein